MSRQVELYLTPADTQLLEQALRSFSPLRVLHSRALSDAPRVVENLNYVENNHRWLFYGLIREQDVEKIKLNHVPAQNYWSFDVLCAPIIEFSGCFFDGKILRSGRIFYQKSYHLNGELVEKSDDFLTWANSIFSITKKNLRRKELAYYGPEAFDWGQMGVGRVE